MRLINLFEDEKTDRTLRSMASAVFDNFYRRIEIEALNNYENFHRIDNGPFSGGFMLSGAYAGLRGEGISAVVFLPHENYNFRASLGNYSKSNDKVLFLACLTEPFSLRHLKTRLSAFKKDFVHEWSHHQLNDRYSVGSINKSMDGEGNIDPVKYYNDAHETQAFYQEAAYEAENFFKIVAKHAPHRLPEYSVMTTADLVSFISERFVNRDFLKFINQKNRQALMKRLARMVDQTIRPLIFEPIS